ncbi:MAG: SpoIIIAH-like family protein [Pseudoflavonifractor sp.]
MGDTSVSVVVGATDGGLTDSDVAKISEIVTEETGLDAGNVRITETDQ